MDNPDNNQSAKNLTSSSQSVPLELQEVRPAKAFNFKPTRNPFKIRKLTSVGFQKAEWQQAKKNVKQLSVRHLNGQKVPYTTDLNHFRIYGPGIYLFFNFAKKVIFLFLILLVLSIIPLIYNPVVGESYSTTKNSPSKYLGVLTIGNLRPYGQRHDSLADKLINAIPAFFSSLIFFAFYILWNRKSQEQIHSVRSSFKLVSYETVQVFKFPKDITQAQIFYYMSQFGQIKQISTVRSYNQTIYYCKAIYEKTLDGKQMLLQRQKMQIPSDQLFEQQIQKRQKQLQELYHKLQEQEKNSSKQIIKFFVTYQSPQERQKAVEVFLPYIKKTLPCVKLNYPDELRARGQQILVRACHTQPAGILWQNVHITWKTRWIRLLLQLLLIVIVIFLGFCFILILNVLNPPITTSKIDSSAYNSTTITTVSDPSMVRSWCLNHYDMVQQNPDSDYGKLCGQYLSSNASRVFISIAIALGIMFIKYVLKYTVLHLSKFMRYKTYTEEAVQMTKNLFFTYFFSTVFITMFMQARFDQFSPKQLVKYISSSNTINMNLKQLSDFSDMNSGWYLDVGYQIWITWFILAITYPILILSYHYPLEKLCRYLAQKQVLQRKMEKYLMPQQFEIYDHYANLGLFIFVGFVFSPGMPSLILLTTFGLVLRYWYFKFTFIRFSKIPKPLDQSLNTLLLRILIFGLFSHIIMAIWMYGVNDLFDHKDSPVKHKLYDDDDGNFRKFWMILFKRMIDSLYLTALLVFYIFYFFLWQFLRSIYLKCTNQVPVFKASPDMLKDTIGNGGYVMGIKSQRTLTKSYKIQNNPDYFDIFVVIQRKQLLSTIRPSYEQPPINQPQAQKDQLPNDQSSYNQPPIDFN